MNVKNRKCIRKLSWRSLWASRKRNIIAIIAIALTALLFTSLFTIVMSINSSYEMYTFRQVGGYCHGTFKEVTEEQIKNISAQLPNCHLQHKEYLSHKLLDRAGQTYRRNSILQNHPRSNLQ